MYYFTGNMRAKAILKAWFKKKRDGEIELDGLSGRVVYACNGILFHTFMDEANLPPLGLSRCACVHCSNAVAVFAQTNGLHHNRNEGFAPRCPLSNPLRFRYQIHRSTICQSNRCVGGDNMLEALWRFGREAIVVEYIRAMYHSRVLQGRVTWWS